MTHEEKLNFMKIAAGIVGYGFDKKGLDMLVSMYDLVLEKKGETDLHSIVKVECAVEEREKERVEAKKLKDKSDSPQNPKLGISVVSGSLPSVDEAGIMAVKISEMVEPPLTAQEQSFFIAGFCECVKWLGSNDR